MGRKEEREPKVGDIVQVDMVDGDYSFHGITQIIELIDSFDAIGDYIYRTVDCEYLASKEEISQAKIDFTFINL